jgi:hypothetical protein
MVVRNAAAFVGARRSGARARSARLDQSGQTATEYLMILGLLTAMIAVLTKIIVPGVAFPVVKLVQHMVAFLSSV